MFIGHFAIALAAKKAAPKVSLGTLFIACEFLDLLWPLFLLFSIEHVKIEPGNTKFTPLDFYDYPISHSLAGAIIWTLALGIIYFIIRKIYRPESLKILLKSAIIVGLVVISHWILDFISHRPDLPLSFDNSTFFGLGLWNSIPGTLIVEIGLYIAGIVLYLSTTQAFDRIGVYGFWVLIALLFIIYLMNIFGPPPPNIKALAIAGNTLWIFIFWAYWVDRHRKSEF